jgi:hypothetical protein
VPAQLNIVSFISDVAILLGFAGGLFAVGRKVGFYQKTIMGMSKQLAGACRDLEDLDLKRQSLDVISAKQEEKLSHIIDTLQEVKEMLYAHVMEQKH